MAMIFDLRDMKGEYHGSPDNKPCLNSGYRITFSMAYEDLALDATLAAAAGDDPALLLELRSAFGESVDRQVDLLRRARCDGNWKVAAMRLKGLGASFHTEPLMRLADEALEAAPGEPVVLAKLQRFVRDFDAQGE